jgi:hypothetical protein
MSMIWESWCWRTDQKKFADSLRKRQKQKRWPDRSLARCEQTIMVGFFSVRKLIESRKLSRDFADRQVKATAYPTKGKHVHLLNVRRDVDELFNLDAPKQTTMKIEDLANQLIHSYIFYLSMEVEGQLNGILVASDRIRNKELLQVSSLDVIKIFELAAKGEGDKAISMNYDDKRQDYIVRLAKPKKRRT